MHFTTRHVETLEHSHVNYMHRENILLDELELYFFNHRQVFRPLTVFAFQGRRVHVLMTWQTLVFRLQDMLPAFFLDNEKPIKRTTYRKSPDL